jgi:hypothetical protein
MGYIGNAPFGGQITGDNVLDGSIKAEDLAPGAAVPTQTGQSGKYLTTDGTTASWGTVSQVPSQTGQTGKYLTTDGTTASWSTVATGVRVTGITYSGNDLATSPNGGQTVTLAGSGFASTPTVFVDGTIAPSVSFVSSSQITFVTPAKSAGTYHVYVVNPDGSTAIFVNGISYSGVPTWTTAAGSLGTYAETFSIQLTATGDAPITYTLATGSSLPAGVSLSSSGLISGTTGTEQTFSFSVDAIDAQNQETPRSFSVTIVIADPYFEYNALLLSGNGANGSQNNTFLDSSTNAFSITRNGNITQGTFSPFSQTGWSNYFNASTNYLAASGAGLSVESSNFTWEGWFNFNSPSENAVRVMMVNYTAGFTTGSIFFGKHNNYSGKVAVWVYNYSTGGALLVEPDLPPAGWVHYALVRNGSSWSIFRNGVETVTATYSGVGSTNTAMYIGGTGESAAFSLGGYISNARVVVGSAVYTSNFTPSTTPLTAITNTQLLTCQSNRFVDNSTNAFAITRNGDVSVQAFSPLNPTAAWSAATYGGSGYFDGSGDYLDIAHNAALTPAGDFTIEFWAYPLTASGIREWYTKGIGIQFYSNGAAWGLALSSNNSGTYYINATFGTLIANAWQHVVLTRSGNSYVGFVNGVATSLGTTSSAPGTGTDALRIGDLSVSGGYPVFGYMSAVRYVNGTAVYGTSNFTPPTSPPTAVANTQLLTNFTNAGIYDATSKNDLETVGNAQISTTQSKFGGSSMYFDGTGDRLYKPAIGDPLTDLGAGGEPFTVEQWVYFTTLSGQFLFSVGKGGGTAGWNSSSGHQYLLGLMSGGSLYLQSWSGSGISSVSVANPFSTGQWIHYAVSCDGTTTKVFVNGSQVISAAVAYARITNPTRFVVGDTPSYDAPFSGYIQDLRITKGYARYTANFTPPTTAHKLR